MCQVYGPAIHVACSKCGASCDERWIHTHKCKVFKPFEQWNKELQTSAAKEYTGDNWIYRVGHQATQTVAGWPEWMRHSVWSEEYQFSTKESL